MTEELPKAIVDIIDTVAAVSRYIYLYICDNNV